MSDPLLEKYRRIAKKLKNPTPVELPSGKFRCQVTVNGQRESVIDDDPRVAHAEALAIRSSLKQARRSPDKKTVSEAIDEYIESKSNSLSPSTIRGYRTIQRSRFQDVMGRDIYRVSADDWQACCNREALLCSAKTLKNSWMFLATVIHKTTGQRIGVSLPPVVRKERPYLDHDQILTFVEAVRGKPVEIPALLALCSLRRSEILGLRWRDIDTTQNLIHVNGAAVVDENFHLIQKSSNKTKSSQRVVPILIPRLSEAVNESRGDGDAMVVTCNRDQILLRINRVCKACGLPLVGVHGLRHTFATMFLEHGMDVKTLSAIIGHVSSKTTLNIYTHITSEMEENAAASIDRGIAKVEVEERTAEKSVQPQEFVPYTAPRRRPGTGYIKQLNDHLWEGRYSPVWPDGKKHSRNVYSRTREEAEAKLADLILQMKAEIAALRSGKATEYPDGVSPKKKQLAAYLRENPGVSNKSYIARQLGMDVTTVRKYYDEVREELVVLAV